MEHAETGRIRAASAAASLLDQLPVVGGYLVLFAVLDLLSRAEQPGWSTVVWYPSSGLSLAFLLGFGLRMWPAVAAGYALAAWAALPGGKPLLPVLAAALATSVVFLLMTLAVRWLRLDLSLRRLGDLARFLVLTAVGAIALGVLRVWATEPSSGLAATALVEALAHCIGIVAATPFLLVHALPWIERLSAEGNPPAATEHRVPGLTVSWKLTAAQTLLTAAVVLLVFVWNRPIDAPVVYLCFVPLIWVSLSHGLAGAVIATLILNLAATFSIASVSLTAELAETQALLLTLSFTGLFLGAAVNQRRQAVEQLEVEKAYLEQLFQSAPEAIVVVDNQSRILRANAEFTRMFGYESSEYLGQRVDRLIVPDDFRDEAMTVTEKIVKQGSVSLESTRRRKDGKLINVSILGTPIKVDGGQVAVYGIYRDVTARRDLEEQLRQAQKMEAVGRLAGGVAHDFNNLLTAILGYTELLKDEIAQGKGSINFVEEVRRAANRAKALTGQLLAFSRKQVLTPKVVSLGEIVANIEPMLGRLLGENIVLESRYLGPSSQIKADPGQIEQVIVNLAVNARDAMRDGGCIVLEIDDTLIDEATSRRLSILPGRYVRLRFCDNGSGMKKEVLRHIFEPFFTTKEQGKGTGLGLATVYGIVKQSGGHIEVASSSGEGTEFTIYFPHVGEEDESRDFESNAYSEAAPQTILVVEDEEPIRDLITGILRNNGYRVLQAREGSQALLTAESFSGPINLLLTDVVMPEISGRELAVRLSDQRPNLRVLYMSGFTDDVPEGGDDSSFLQKPFSSEILLRKVGEALKRRPARQAPSR